MLTDSDRKNLTSLQARGITELEAPKQVAYWRDMAERGFAVMRTQAIVGIERVKGDYVKISEAGKFALREY